MDSATVCRTQLLRCRSAWKVTGVQRDVVRDTSRIPHAWIQRSSSEHLPALFPAVLPLRVIKNYLVKAPVSCSFVNTPAQLVVNTVEVAMMLKRINMGGTSVAFSPG